MASNKKKERTFTLDEFFGLVPNLSSGSKLHFTKLFSTSEPKTLEEWRQITKLKDVNA